VGDVAVERSGTGLAVPSKPGRGRRNSAKNLLKDSEMSVLEVEYAERETIAHGINTNPVTAALAPIDPRPLPCPPLWKHRERCR
jgi:hypothetical protein